MKGKRIYIYFTMPVLLLAIARFPVKAQNQMWEHELLNVTHGLPHDAVRAIFQDSEGYMWFGTEYGLSRYDGHRFKNYTADYRDSTKLKSDWVNAICEDNDGNLWIGTIGGFHKFDKKNEVFTRYIFDLEDTVGFDQNAVMDLEIDKSGNIWLGTGNKGIVRFDPSTGTFKSFVSRTIDWVPTLRYYTSNKLIVSTWPGVVAEFNIETESFEEFTDLLYKQTLDSFQLYLTAGNDDDVLISGYYGFGALKPDFSEVYDYPNSSVINDLGDDREINGILVDIDSNIWVRTFGGIFQFSPDYKLLYSLRLNPPGRDFMGVLRTKALYQSKDGIIWFGSQDGVHKLTKRKNQFKIYQHDVNDKNSLSHNIVEAITIDSNNVIWVGTNYGLNCIDRTTNSITRFYASNDTNSINADGITCMLTDSKGTVWIGSHFGLNKVISSDSEVTFKQYFHNSADSATLSGDWIQNIYEDSSNKLWILLAHNEPDYFDPETETFTQLVNVKETNYPLLVPAGVLFEFETGELFAAGMSGAYMVREPFKKINNFTFSATDVTDLYKEKIKHSTSTRSVIQAIKSSESVVWLATYGSGIIQLKFEHVNGETQLVSSKNYARSAGLPSNVVFSILEDTKGYLWLGTDNGLAKFDPMTETSVNYNVEDGLPGRRFYWRAAHKSKSGELFMGTEEGLVTFHPDSLAFNKVPPPVVISEVKIYRSTNALKKHEPTQSFLAYQSEIKLTHDQNYVSIEFASLNYISPERNRYKYILQGHDEEWLDAINGGSASYSNLKPGEYTFKVMGSNSDGVWNDEGASFIIHISPPWWKSRVAYLMYFLFIALLIYIFIKVRERKLIRDKEELERVIQKRTGELQEVNVSLEEHHEELEQQKEELQQTLNYLKDTQSQLVQSEKMASIGQLTAGIAHEINNPVNYINAGIDSLEVNLREIGQVLDLYGELTPENSEEKLAQIEQLKADLDYHQSLSETRELLKSVKAGSERTTQIVKGLRTFSRLDEDDVKKADIHEGIDLTLVMLHNKYKHHVKIIKNYGDIPEIECYPGKLNQVFMNIISNAVDAIPEKGTITISTSMNKSRKEVCISIKDSGIGMDNSDKKHIFNPFFTTKEVGKGTGLGLSVSHGIIEQHKGTIKVSSALGKGSEFVIQLPVSDKL